MNKKHIKEEGLRDWFGKSKSKGGKKGWVNVVTGDSCASDKPGEGIPKCVSSSKRASMSKKERVAAQAAKRREDPGQQKKSGASKPTMVKTDRKVRKEEKFVPPYEELKTVAREKEKKKSRMKAMEVNGAFDENVSSGRSRIAKSGRVQGKPVGAITNAEYSTKLKKQKDEGKAKDKSVADKVDVSGMSPFDAARVKKRAEFKAEKERLRAQKKVRREETEVLDEAKDKKGKGSGSKDACYHKVKSRYDVWPSAYASGALVKCRKVGAANWGNKSEETEMNPISFQQFQEKCWKGIAEAPKYDKQGLDKFDRSKRMIRHKQDKYGVSTLKQRLTTGADHNIDNEKKAKNEEVEIRNEGAAWTKKSGKDSEGGLNEKGRKSYERENPGSDLKRPSKKVGNPRRASFCARMSGMKKKLTSKKTANDPDSRINKSLRAWNC